MLCLSQTLLPRRPWLLWQLHRSTQTIPPPCSCRDLQLPLPRWLSAGFGFSSQTAHGTSVFPGVLSRMPESCGSPSPPPPKHQPSPWSSPAPSSEQGLLAASNASAKLCLLLPPPEISQSPPGSQLHAAHSLPRSVSPTRSTFARCSEAAPEVAKHSRIWV